MKQNLLLSILFATISLSCSTMVHTNSDHDYTHANGVTIDKQFIKEGGKDYLFFTVRHLVLGLHPRIQKTQKSILIEHNDDTKKVCVGTIQLSSDVEMSQMRIGNRVIGMNRFGNLLDTFRQVHIQAQRTCHLKEITKAYAIGDLALFHGDAVDMTETVVHSDPPSGTITVKIPLKNLQKTH